jgi:hypothetical protein
VSSFCTNGDFAIEGALHFKGVLRSSLQALEAAIEGLPTDGAGVRLRGIQTLRPLLALDGAIGVLASSILRRGARPVRAILFNKSPETNWSLGWHQDRTICVQEKRDVLGFGPWTIKAGMHHVAPPIEILARMVTLRAHLDDVPTTNAPLLIAPGSHLVGRIPESDIDEVVRRYGTMTCIAEKGDVWLYSTPILHASEAASMPKSRRVLQVDYSADDLPEGLQWLGV